VRVGARGVGHGRRDEGIGGVRGWGHEGLRVKGHVLWLRG